MLRMYTRLLFDVSLITLVIVLSIYFLVPAIISGLHARIDAVPTVIELDTDMSSAQ